MCEHGYGKRSRVEDFRQTNRGGVGVRSIITSERNGKVVAAVCVSDDDSMVLMSGGGQTIRFRVRDMRVMGRNTQGVRIVNLRDDDKIVATQKLEGVAAVVEEGVDQPIASLGDEEILDEEVLDTAEEEIEEEELDVVEEEELEEDDESPDESET